MKLVIAFALVGLVAAASLNDDRVIVVETPVIDNKLVVDDTPIVQDDSPIVQDDSPIVQDDSPIVQDDTPIFQDDTPIIQDDSPFVQDDNISPVVLPEAPLPSFEHVDIRMVIIPDSVLEELKLGEVVDPVQFVDNTNTDGEPINTVHFVDFADNTGFEPIAAGELESVRVSQDEFPYEGLSPETVHVVDLPVFENLRPRYPDPTWR